MLGHGFVPTYKKGEKGKYQLVVKKASWAILKRKLNHFTKKTLPYSFEERLRKLKEVWLGWVNNYRLASIQLKLKTLDEWLRNRLRYCIWHDWKKLERKRKNLIRLGIPYGQASAWSRTRMGGWAVAQSPILRTTITLDRLRKRGYQSLSEHYAKVSPLLNEPPYMMASRSRRRYRAPVRTVVSEAHRGLMAHGRLLEYIQFFTASCSYFERIV